MISCTESAEGVVFRIKVLPRSSRCAVVGCHGDALKIKISAPPVEGKANEAIVRFLAECLRVKPAQVAIVAGQQGQLKTVRVSGMNGVALASALTPWLAKEA